LHQGAVGDGGHAGWHEEDVDGEVYDYGTGDAGMGGAEGVGDDPGDFLCVGDAVGEFGDGFGEDDLVVEALEAVCFGIA
jgi:hypothetical protein